jgi:hypothetical protein
MRLNRENTLIENNLYPLAGCHPAEVQTKFVELLKPLESDILQIEAALLLHNIPLLIVFGGFVLGFLGLSRALTPCVISYLTYAIIVVPVLTLVYTLGGVAFGRSLYLKDLPDLPPADPRRIHSLEEIVSYAWAPLLWGWRAAFFVYRTYVCPNPLDAGALVIGAIILGLLAKIVNPLSLLLTAAVIGLAAPAVLALTPAKQLIGEIIAAVRSRARPHPKEE